MMAPHTTSLSAAITQLAASTQAQAGFTDASKAADRAWTILLDLGTQAVPDIQDRQHANTRATARACVELSQRHRSADAAKLEQLVQEWLSTTHYVCRLDAQQPASSNSTSGGSRQGFLAVPLSEQHAVLSLLLALRGSCPATSPVLTSLPALGSSWLKGLQQEVQVAVTSGSSSSSWVPMSAHPEELIAARCAQQAGRAATSPPADPNSTGFRSWVSPAAAAMQLLQQMSLDAAAGAAPASKNTAALQAHAVEAPDDVLIAAACADAPAGASLPAQARPASVLTPPLLQEIVPRMQLASNNTSLGRPLLLPCSSLQTTATTHSSGARMARQSSAHVVPQAGHAVSAAAAEAEAAIKAAAAVRPWVASLMQLSAAQPGSGSSTLLGLQPCVDNSSSGGGICGGKKDAAAAVAGRDSDTGMTKDVRPLVQRQQEQQHLAKSSPSCAATATSSSSATKSRQELEAQLVSTACLALQGVWSAVEQLWHMVLQGACAEHGTPHADRVRRPAAQHQLLVQVLHTAELRLRLTAFLQHFQHSSCSSSHATGCSSGSADAEQAVQLAFINGVQRLLAELDSSVTTGQVKRLLQRQQQGRDVSLLQLLRVQRDLARELQQLAEVCWCTVQGYVDDTLFLSTDFEDCFKKEGVKSDVALPVKPTSSSSMNWHLLQQAHTAKQARAAAAALQGAAAAAYGAALPWPGRSEGSHAVQLGWAPSTWQLRGGIEGGYLLLERLYAGVVQAGASAPLLRHLFAAAVQPVLASLHAWAFLPDTQAAEAAAEATAMASFTAGSTSSSNAHSGNSGGTTVGLLVASMQGPGGASTVAPFASVAAAVPGAAAAAAPTQPMGHNASGGGAGGSGSGSGSSKAWTGSKAAEAAMLQCLQAAWDDVCARPPRCPGFLLHAQGPAGVAGMQLHLLQLLGGPGQALAERLGWLAELEQQEIQEVLAGPGASTAAATSSCTDVATSGTTAAAAAAAAGTFMGLLGGAGSALGLPAAVGLNAQSPACDISTQQLKQCVAITRDFNAARELEMERLLQDLAQRRAATLQAHELWLAGRQEQRQEAEAARSRLAVEAAARRRQRERLLLAQQQEDVAAAQARRLGTRMERLSLEQHLLRQSTLQEHQQAVQQLLGELCKLDEVPPPAAAAAGGRVSSFAAAAGTAVPAEGSDAAVDSESILLDVTAVAAATAGGTGDNLFGAEPSGEPDQQQQQQQQRHTGTWDSPLQDIGPAAGAPSGQQAAGPLAVIGSAAAAAVGTAAVQAAGRRSNSQPKVLPGMGRPVSASHSRRGSEDGQAAGAGFPCGDPAGADSSAPGAAGAGAGAGTGKAGRGSGGAGSMSSILGGGFGSAFGARLAQQQQQGPMAKGKWGVPVVPGAAAGVASTLQRRASTPGNLALPDSAASSSSREPGQHQQQQQQQALMQRQPSGGLGPSSRPVTPRGRRVSDAAVWCEGAAGAAAGRQQQLQRQQSWHHMQLQQQQHQQHQVAMELASHGAEAAEAAAVWEHAALAAAAQGAVADGTAAAAASTGWLQSRHERKREEQGNRMILGWLTDEIGLGRGQDSSSSTDTSSDAADPGVKKRPVAATAAAAAAAAGAAVARAATYGQGEGPEAAAAASARPAAPIVSALEVLVVQPVLAQQRLTTVTCWSLLLHEHQLLQRLSTIQGLFFQQQGDWVGLLCDALEPLLLRQQQQQGAGSVAAAALVLGSDGGGSSQVQAGMSPVVLQLLLEAAVQQSCLAGVTEAQRLSLQAVPGRGLVGWTRSSSSSSSGDAIPASTAAGGATDCLLLGYDVPWPVSLLLSGPQLRQYAEIFSVLLRLRRLQQQLMKQWQPLSHRASSEAPTAAAPRRRRHASEFGPEPNRGSAGGGAAGSGSRGPHRSTWPGGVPAALSTSQGGDRGGSNSRAAGEGILPVLTVGLSRLQDLRRWHGLALHCVSSLLGYMLGELSGQLQGRFEAAVGSRPVELPVMLQAHARLLEEARQVCFLPQQQQQQQTHSGGGGGGLAAVAYAIVDRAWELQQHVAELLAQQHEGSAAAGTAAGSGSSRVLARAPSGFKEGTSCSELAAALEGGGSAEEAWESVSCAGQRLEQLVDVLRHQLRGSAQAGAGHLLAGLAARLGV